jgi:hypothetical protein
MSKKEENTNGGCLMGPNWMTYVIYIILGIIFILLVVWISSTYLISNSVESCSQGKLLLQQFSNDCVKSVK